MQVLKHAALRAFSPRHCCRIVCRDIVTQTMRATKEKDMDVHTRIIKTNYKDCPEVSRAVAGRSLPLLDPIQRVRGLAFLPPRGIGARVTTLPEVAQPRTLRLLELGAGEQALEALQKTALCSWCTLLKCVLANTAPRPGPALANCAQWWFLVIGVVSIALAIVALVVWKDILQVRRIALSSTGNQTPYSQEPSADESAAAAAPVHGAGRARGCT